MSEGPHIEKVKSAVMVRLAEPETDQVIAITAQGTHVGIAMSIGAGTHVLWANCLREIADQLEAGVESAEDFSDAFGKITN